MEKYTLQRGKNFEWTCTDNESGLVITFREGMFNDTQNINIDNLKGIDSPMAIPSLLTGMTDWLAQNYACIVECNAVERGDAIRALMVEEYWKVLVTILNGHLLTNEDDDQALMAELEDADDSVFEQWEVDRDEMIYCADSLGPMEAHEVFAIVDAFWQMEAAHDIDLREWARDLLWWPAFLPQERREPQDAEAFGRELRETRQSLDITLQELAKRSGVDTGLISKIENGKANPTLQNLLKLANAMGTDLVFEA